MFGKFVELRTARSGECPQIFFLYVFTLMLVLPSYHRFVSGLGPTFEKIALTLGMSRFARSGVW